MPMFSNSEIAQLRNRFPELAGLDRSSIDQRLIDDLIFNRRNAHRNWLNALPATKAAAEAAYQTAYDRYKMKNPAGKNAAKAGLRAAREIWSGFQK